MVHINKLAPHLFHCLFPACNGREFVANMHESMELIDGGGNNNGILQVPLGDAGEVWLMAADWNGNTVNQGHSCFGFYAEGHWYTSKGDLVRDPYNGENIKEIHPGIGIDVNDYLFDSLVCCEPQDDNFRIYIIIDGVLVDSCPKEISQNCRQC